MSPGCSQALTAVIARISGSTPFGTKAAPPATLSRRRFSVSPALRSFALPKKTAETANLPHPPALLRHRSHYHQGEQPWQTLRA
jgi:hypothetical protein